MQNFNLNVFQDSCWPSNKQNYCQILFDTCIWNLRLHNCLCISLSVNRNHVYASLWVFHNMFEFVKIYPINHLQMWNYWIITAGLFWHIFSFLQCAVIQLPSQTLLLSVSDKAYRLIGMLFPGVRMFWLWVQTLVGWVWIIGVIIIVWRQF